MTSLSSMSVPPKQQAVSRQYRRVNFSTSYAYSIKATDPYLVLFQVEPVKIRETNRYTYLRIE